jgi:MFS family permease
MSELVGQRARTGRGSGRSAPPAWAVLLAVCAGQFLVVLDVSVVNVALPSIRADLGLGETGQQWVVNAYALTFAGFMLLGGRAADLFGRRRILVTGTTIFGLASLAGGFADTAGLLVGVLAGGLLTDGPGWRWVMFVNPPFCVLILVAAFRMFEPDGKRVALRGLDLVGAFLATAGMLLLVFGLVKAPDQGWGSGRTMLELGGAGVLLVAFVVNERFTRNPLLPLSIFRIKGLAAADVTQLVGVAGFISMFFFLTLYMQNVEGWSPIRTGLAYLPITAGVGIGAGVAPKLVAKVGTRPVVVSGAAIAAVGVYLLAQLKVHGSYVSGLLPGMVIMAIGLGFLFVAITTAANAGVPHHQAGLAAALLNASQQVGGALGLAVFAAISTARLNHELKAGAQPTAAFTSGLSWALTACAIAVACAAVLALRTRNVHSEAEAEALADVEELVAAG